MAGERPLSTVPKTVIGVFLGALLLQILFHAGRPEPRAHVSDLPPAFPDTALSLVSMGEPVALSNILMLWLQGFDYQASESIPFARLDYRHLAGWLDAILALDPRGHYPLLSAARIYSEVPDDDRKRIMLDFVYEKFIEDPDGRWQWLAHAVYVARHRLGDPELALEYAAELRKRTTPESAPDWARQMEIFILEDMGELQAARVLLGGLIESGVIRDPNELRFLEERLDTSMEDYTGGQEQGAGTSK